MLIFSEHISEEYASLWDATKNTSPMNIPRKRTDKVWIKCLNGLDHSFEARMDRLPSLEKRSECTVCSGKRLYPELNSLGAIYPQLISKYSTKNKKLPTEVSSSLRKRYWWYCKEHDLHYQASIKSMLAEKRLGCELCEKYRISLGKNYPELLAEWDYSKNVASPYEVSAHNTAWVWWICTLGHSYRTQVNDKTSRNHACPICSGRRVLEGFNDLETKAPQSVISEYDVVKNTLSPKEIYWKSEIKVWWKCDKGHTWATRVNHRTVSGTNCPKCSAKISKAEQELFNALTEYFPDLEQGRRDVLTRNLEIDIYSSKHNFGIEYCGVYWHNQDKFPRVHEIDHEKQTISNEIGLPIYIVWEDDYTHDPTNLIESLLLCIQNKRIDDRFTLRCSIASTGASCQRNL